LEKALKCFREAEKDGESARLDLLIGEQLMRWGVEDEAHIRFLRAGRLDPTHKTDLFIAELNLEMGHRANALNHLRRALDRCGRGDNDVPRIVQLAVAAGDREAARLLLLDAVKLSDEPRYPRLLL